ncbi:MetQ/NlpA family ABC transporter substrate-binding protein [Aerococcus sp. UMB8487]|uniref:MetQ/NlpA family ABC transporter substrate-binding protein n=1 Tax=Aerococcus sp. UMB8487 TaxID=3046346 RepID=UPI00254C3DD3|nr:MetQ/NlpA family ABC transporter substrate-binding protein [Aerococcus sp. UMB8487]MDK6940879.1 MetQ/NlpA family ABC transporter substrate-binding protein [Aerococcus sp. UMB8487]
MRKILTLLSLALLVLTACHKQVSSDENQENNRVSVASFGSDLEIWQHVAQSQAAKDAGLEIEVKDITSNAQLNDYTAKGDVDVNAFQTFDFLETWNADHGNSLAPVATTYIEPMGIYSERINSLSERINSLDELEDGATVAIANNPSQQARALKLLANANLIKLNKKEGLVNLKDIQTNPKNLEFIEVDDTLGVRVLKDVDIAPIGNTFAMEGGLSVQNDALFKEDPAHSSKENYNVIVSQKDRAKDEKLKKLAEIYHAPENVKFIEDKFKGSKVVIDESLEGGQ